VDASSTTMFDTAKRNWAWDILERFGLPAGLFPEVKESSDIAGTISPSCAAETGLPAGIPVIYGSGDQPAQSIGNGVIKGGRIISNIGTGGQISALLLRRLMIRSSVPILSATGFAADIPSSAPPCAAVCL